LNKEGGDNRDKTGEGEILSQERTVGEILLEAREKAGLSLEDVSGETKIPRRMLEYLETDNFDAFPARVYARGFLKSYAELLGLDVDYILNKFEVQTTQDHKSRGDMWEIETEVVEERIAPPGLIKKVLVAIVVIVVLFIVIKALVGGRDEPKPEKLPDIKEEVLKRSREVESRGVSKNTEVVENIKGEEIKSSMLGPPAEKKEGASRAATGKPRKDMMELTITANPEDSVWFEIAEISSRASGQDTNRYSFLLLPGQRKVFRANELFLIEKVGNAGGFRMTLDGRELPPLGARGVVKSNIVIGKDFFRKNRAQ